VGEEERMKFCSDVLYLARGVLLLLLQLEDTSRFFAVKALGCSSWSFCTGGWTATLGAYSKL